jgi:hypothetical protein
MKQNKIDIMLLSETKINQNSKETHDDYTLIFPTSVTHEQKEKAEKSKIDTKINKTNNKMQEEKESNREQNQHRQKRRKKKKEEKNGQAMQKKTSIWTENPLEQQ